MLDRVFGNRYRLVEKIGIGGMAEVYKSTDEVLGRTVAVKVMLPQYAADPTFAARFKQEAQSAANLQSPYIVNIYDWGQDSTDGTYYIVMEYVRGTDLKTAIQQRGAINQRKVAEIGSQVCAALNVAHGYDIIHRDIKPHNIMVQPDGNAKVMDFGIARASGSSMTQTGSVLGTAYYISPEQAQGKPLAPATDLYSLGVVLYEAATGKVPFDAPDAVAVALKQVNEQPVPPSQINPEVDPQLESIIMRALAKNPQERYTTAEQMRVALNNYLAGRPVDTNVDGAAQTRVMTAGAMLPVINADGAQPPTHTAVMPSVGGQGPGQALSMRSAARAKEEEDRKKKKRMITIGVIASIICVIAIGTVLFFMLNGAAKVDVPDVVGMTEDEAKAAIEESGLVVGDVKIEANETVEAGKVISSDPSAQEKVKEGSEVNLVVSSGPEPPKKVKVPDLKNKTIPEAKTELEALKLKLERGDDVFDPEVEVGKISTQEPPAETEVDEGTTIILHVSKGKDTTSVPDVKGKTEAEAATILEAQGLVLGEVSYADDDDVAEGLIISQSPTTASTADKGTAVDVVVSNGPTLVSVPDVTGVAEAVARNKVTSAGFRVGVVTAENSDTVPEGCVISYSPESAVEGSAIDMVISKGPSTS